MKPSRLSEEVKKKYKGSFTKSNSNNGIYSAAGKH